MLIKMVFSARCSTRSVLFCLISEKISCPLSLKFREGPEKCYFCTANIAHIVENVTFLLRSHEKERFIFIQFSIFVSTVMTSEVFPIFRHSAQVLLENALLASEIAYSARNSAGTIYPSLIRRCVIGLYRPPERRKHYSGNSSVVFPKT